jgi:hypothetical protein
MSHLERAPANGQTANAIDVTFNSHGFLLKGKFYVARGEGPFPTLILLQGFPGNEQDVLGVGQRISEAGINALTFNYSGTYRSEGKFGFENTLKDINAAYRYVHQQETITEFKVDTTKIYLGGASYGGGMALTYAANHPEIKDVISIACADHGGLAREYSRNASFAKTIDSIFEGLKAPKGPVRFEGKEAIKTLLDNADSYDLRKSAPSLANRDILLIGGLDDVITTIENHLLPLYRTLRKEGAQNLQFIVYQTDHSFKNVRDQLAKQIIDWIKSQRAPDVSESAL